MKIFNKLQQRHRRLLYACGARPELYAWAERRGGAIVFDGPATRQQRRQHGARCWRVTVAVPR